MHQMKRRFQMVNKDMLMEAGKERTWLAPSEVPTTETLPESHLQTCLIRPAGLPALFELPAEPETNTAVQF